VAAAAVLSVIMVGDNCAGRFKGRNIGDDINDRDKRVTLP